MIDVLELRNSIATALASEVGLYTFPSGQSTPAIVVEDGAIRYVEEPTAQGLEVVIIPDVDPSAPTYFHGGDMRLDTQVKVVLKQWDAAKTTKVAREILIRLLDDIERIALVPRSTRLDAIESCTLTLSDSYYLLRLQKDD